MDSHTTVLVTNDVRGLLRVREPDVAAVVLRSQQQPWMDRLANAVESCQLRIPRTVLQDVTVSDIRGWLGHGVQVEPKLGHLRDALVADLVELVRLAEEVTGGNRFVFRIFTEAPQEHCGYHVDTVMPGAPPWGLVRVYNGVPTSYVDPTAVRSMRDFYRYLGRRERLVRQAETEADAQAERDVARLDAALPFLNDADAVRGVPSGAIVAFTHLDAHEMFAPSTRQPPWIHCSPMTGAVRLVVNVSAVRGARLPPRAGVADGRPAEGRAG